MQVQGKFDDLGFSPSFNCYSLTSTAAADVSREFKHEQADQFRGFSDFEEEDFDFSLILSGEEASGKDLDLGGRILFPIFDSDLLMKDEVDREVEGIDDPSSVIPLQELFVVDRDDSTSSSSSELDESEGRTLTKSKKSKSTGSGSKKWRIRDLLRLSNSGGKELVFFLCPIKMEASKRKRSLSSGDIAKVNGKSKTTSSPSFHELFYVQKRAEKDGSKMKSYLPYRQDVLGFFANVNTTGSKKKSPFSP